jgi:hypothetical protein
MPVWPTTGNSLMAKPKQLVKYHVYNDKQAYENKFTAWAKGKPEYEGIWPAMQRTMLTGHLIAGFASM